MRMDVETIDHRVVLGLCPGCQNWQVDYQPRSPDLELLSMEELYAVVEGVLAEHLAECPHLRQLIG